MALCRFPFGSLVPLWSRQIPYTMAKFFFFEKVVEAFYTHVFTAPKESYAKSTQLGITFASGYLAGVICAIVSHPADTVSFVANDCVFFHSRNGEEFRERQKAVFGTRIS